MTAVFIYGNVNDPESASNHEISMAFKHFPAYIKYLGTGTSDGEGGGIDPYRYKYLFPIESISYPRSSSVTEQDHGRMMKILEKFLTARYKFLYRVYEGLIGSSPAYRADFNRSDLDVATTNNTFWYATAATLDNYPDDSVQGKLPMAVRRAPDEPDVSFASGGRYDLAFSLESIAVFGSIS